MLVLTLKIGLIIYKNKLNFLSMIRSCQAFNKLIKLIGYKSFKIKYICLKQFTYFIKLYQLTIFLETYRNYKKANKNMQVFYNSQSIERNNIKLRN